MSPRSRRAGSKAPQRDRASPDAERLRDAPVRVRRRRASRSASRGPTWSLNEAIRRARAPLTSLADAALSSGPSFFPTGCPPTARPRWGSTPPPPSRSPSSTTFASRALALVKSSLPDDADPRRSICGPSTSTSPSRPGAEAAGRRANYGASPGDDGHTEPYLYVGPWSAEVEGELWNATGFTGAELRYSDLLDADQTRARGGGLLPHRCEGVASAG